MEENEISNDDLQDVIEMTQKLEESISEILKENETNLAMSALMSSTINCIISQCRNLEEIFNHKNIFMQFFDIAIKSIKIK